MGKERETHPLDNLGQPERKCDDAAGRAKTKNQAPWHSSGSSLVDIITEMLRSALAWESEQQN
jgi:hypothetical protein